MHRPARALALVAFTALIAVPAAASAQMTQGPPTPLATDLAKVSLGSWASYNMTMGTMPQMSMKMALVSRSASSNTLEMSVEGGMAAAAGKVVSQMTLPNGSTGKVEKTVVQVGTNDPMLMPISGTQFAKPDPKNLVKQETLKVAAGSYKTKHYHEKTPGGDTVDYWVLESVAPIGLVKIEMTLKSNPMINGPIKMELTAVGKDAKASITKPAKPFDQTALTKEMMGGAGAPAGK
ncbi:MAG TPA: hypothetical protein VH853_11120 [Polyangia bacterium]|nr:hypothetical protein [Polyangia bacterium]